MVRLLTILGVLSLLVLLLSVDPSYAQVDPEDISLRTIDSKTFILGDRLRRTLFSRDLHYNDNGTLRDVNLVFINKVSDQASVEVKVQGVNLTV